VLRSREQNDVVRNGNGMDVKRGRKHQSTRTMAKFNEQPVAHSAFKNCRCSHFTHPITLTLNYYAVRSAMFSESSYKLHDIPDNFLCSVLRNKCARCVARMGERGKHGFCEETSQKRDNLEDLGEDGRTLTFRNRASYM
jgi:hypothetical protein